MTEGRLLCLLGRHVWEPHPAFEGLKVRWCVRCRRVEADVFLSGWRHRPHLDGLTLTQCRVRKWHRQMAVELNDQLRRRGSPRALW